MRNSINKHGANGGDNKKATSADYSPPKHHSQCDRWESILGKFAVIYAVIEGSIWLPTILMFENGQTTNPSWRLPVIVAIVMVVLLVPTLLFIDGRVIKRLNTSFVNGETYNMLAGYPSLLLLHLFAIFFAAAIPLQLLGVRLYTFPFSFMLAVCVFIIVVVVGFAVIQKGECVRIKGKTISLLNRLLSVAATIMTFLVVVDILLFILNN
jgi:hypothetical protein